MLANERHKLILEQLRLYGKVKATELAKELDVSEITLRRDLNELHAAGALSRVHGGAIRIGQKAESHAQQTLVGILVPGSAYYFPEVVKGMESVAERENVRLILGISGTEEAEAAQVQRMLDLGVEGIVVTTVLGDGRASELGSWIEAIDIPVVFVERGFGFPHLSKEFDHVRSDHSAGAMLAVRHLHELGHRTLMAGFALTPTAYWLELGFNRGLEHFGMGAGSSVVHFPHHERGPDLVAVEQFLDDALAAGATGLFVHNDTHASAVVDAALARGLSVPADLSIIAYDDVVANLAAVPLSAISPLKRDVGALALEQLLKRLGYRPSKKSTVAHLSLLPLFTDRNSTAQVTQSL